MKPRRSLFWMALAASSATILTGCAAGGEVRSFETSETIEVSEQDERGLWYQSQQFDEELRHSGGLSDDEQLREYLQRVTDRLFPEFIGRLQVHVLKSLVPNAFVIPNGSVYLNAGVLVYLDNEAQLAAILAHEGSHFVHRHSLRSTRTAKQNLAVAAVLGPAIGVPGTAQILAYSSIMGYTRDLEREADREGFRRMLAAGYDTREAIPVFERLARHAEYMDYHNPVFFSSHPRMLERIDMFRSMSAKSSRGHEIGEAAFLAATAGISDAYLEAATERSDYKALIFLLENENKLSKLAPGHTYYLGEAYRRRDDPGDAATAEMYYRRALLRDPDNARAHGALGIVLLKSGRSAEACDHLQRYLQLAPNAADRAYVEGYLARIGGCE